MPSRRLPSFSLFLLGVELLVIILSGDLWLQLGLIAVGLVAAVVEIFYENAGVKQGSWKFAEQGIRIGQLKVEFVPIASAGAVITARFMDWLLDPVPFPIGGLSGFQVISGWMLWFFLVFTCGSFIFFIWWIYNRKRTMETLWLVVPFFLLGLSSQLDPTAHLIAFIIFLTVYLSSVLETLLMRWTEAYTYSHSYRPAATSLAYAFFNISCFLLLVGEKGSQMKILWESSLRIGELAIIGSGFTLVTLLLMGYITQRSAKTKTVEPNMPKEKE